MSGTPRLSGQRLALLAESLSERDMAITGQVARLRLMSRPTGPCLALPGILACQRGRGRTRLPPRSATSHRTATARASRAPDRRRPRGLWIVHLRARAGRATPALRRAAPALYEPTARFVDHTLAISQLIVDATLAHRQGTIRLNGVEQAEPECWRSFSRAGARRVLRPDLYIALDSRSYRYRWWVEVDRASESLPVIVRKCRLYASLLPDRRSSSARTTERPPACCWVRPTSAARAASGPQSPANASYPSACSWPPAPTRARGASRRPTVSGCPTLPQRRPHRRRRPAASPRCRRRRSTAS